MSRIEDAIAKLKAARTRTDAAAEGGDPAVVAMHRRNLSSVPIPQRVVRREASYSIAFDFDRLRSERLLPAVEDERKVSNEYRAIKRGLLGNVTGRSGEQVERPNLIMVASALPGDGKTFTAINLAFSLAREKDFHVVLVDADVVKPNVTRAFQLEDRPGLLDVLVDGTMHLNDVEVGTDLPSLRLVPAGGRHEHASELLGSARMEQVLAEASLDHGTIYVFDSTPLLLTNESRVLAEMVGQVALVVLAGKTPQSAVIEAVELLPQSRFVGLVLNQRRASDEDRYYGYQYGEYGG